MGGPKSHRAGNVRPEAIVALTRNDAPLSSGPDGCDPIADVSLVRAHIITAAREGLALSYSELLNLLGTRFTRPKMRALCKTLDRVDAEGAAAGEPELAVLVVRESDGLPGQGWWTGRDDCDGLWTGDRATAYVRAIQRRAFDYWSDAANRSISAGNSAGSGKRS